MKWFKEGNDCGRLMILIGILVLVPLAILPFYTEDAEYIMAFVIPSVFSLFAGMSVCIVYGNEKKQDVSRVDGQWKSVKTVLFTWIWGIVIGALPFLLSGQLKLIPSLFESVSGWTTTGLSVMDVRMTPEVFLFYRSFMQYCGGLGFIMMIVMLINDRYSMDLFNAEGHPDRLMPNLGRTARTILFMYLGFLVAGTIAYAIAGMPFFDGVCHAMCSLSTGGFSTKLNSIGEYDSFAIEVVTVVLMLLGTTNFAVLLLLVKGKWKRVLQVSEVRFMTVVLGGSIVLTGLSLMQIMPVQEAFRHAFFNTASALSTTGYATMSYVEWPAFAKGMLILLMLVGGGLGSTAGGIKLTRVYLLIRMVGLNIRKKMQPGRCVESPSYYRAQGKTKIDDEVCLDTVGFIGCYLFLYICGVLCLTLACNCSLEDAMFEFASSIGTVGLSIGITGPTTGSAALLIEMAGMLLGRLEIFIVIAGICRSVKCLIETAEKSMVKNRL